MIKYFVNEEKRQVIGLLDGTEFDAINKISNMMADTNFCFCMGGKYMMPSFFRAVVQCDEQDEFSVEEGKKIAKTRILKRYYTSLDKRVNKFFDAAMLFNDKIIKASKNIKNTP